MAKTIFLRGQSAAQPADAVFAAYPVIGAVVLEDAPNALLLAREGREFPASLDDFAQIIGASLRTAKDASPEAAIAALHGRSGCLVPGRGLLAVGRTQREAEIAALVLEKQAYVELAARKLGGAKRLPWLACRIMRYVYQKKYSKIGLDEEAKEGQQA